MPKPDAYYADVPRNKDLKQVLAENVTTVMKAKKLSQPQVAALAKQRGHDIDQTTVGRIARAAIPTTVEKLQAVAAGLGIEPWQLIIDGLDAQALPQIGGDLAVDEQQLMSDYRGASSRWKITIRYMAGLREDNEQEEVASGMNVLLAKILGSKPYPVAKMGAGWKRPDAVHEPEQGKKREPLFRSRDGHSTTNRTAGKKRIVR